MKKILKLISIPDMEEDIEKLVYQIGEVIPFFKVRKLNGKALLEVVQCFKLIEKQADETICEYGEDGQYFYFILEGQVKISIPDKDRKKKFD